MGMATSTQDTSVPSIAFGAGSASVGSARVAVAVSVPVGATEAGSVVGSVAAVDCAVPAVAGAGAELTNHVGSGIQAYALDTDINAKTTLNIEAHSVLDIDAMVLSGSVIMPCSSPYASL